MESFYEMVQKIATDLAWQIEPTIKIGYRIGNEYKVFECTQKQMAQELRRQEIAVRICLAPEIYVRGVWSDTDEPITKFLMQWGQTKWINFLAGYELGLMVRREFEAAKGKWVDLVISKSLETV